MIKLNLGTYGQIDFPEDIALQHGSEIREMLLAILPTTEVRTVLEIGTFEGGTAYVWGQLVGQYPTGKVVCVDVKFGSDYEGCNLKGNHGIPPIYRKTIPGTRIIEIEGRSDDPDVIFNVQKALGGRRVDLLFIDGDHSYTMAKRDFETYCVFVRKGGWIAFHDAVNPVWSCSTLWMRDVHPTYGGKQFVFQQMPKEMQDPHRSEQYVNGIGIIQWEGVLK